MKLIRIWLRYQDFTIEKQDKVPCQNSVHDLSMFIQPVFSAAVCRRNETPRLQYLSSLCYITLVQQTVTFVTDVANMCHRSGTRRGGRLCFPNLVVTRPPLPSTDPPPPSYTSPPRQNQGDQLPFPPVPPARLIPFACIFPFLPTISSDCRRPMVKTRQAREETRESESARQLSSSEEIHPGVLPRLTTVL